MLIIFLLHSWLVTSWYVVVSQHCSEEEEETVSLLVSVS